MKKLLFAFFMISLLTLTNNLAYAEEIVLQPGPEDGTDVWVTSVYSGGGKDNHYLINGGWRDWYYTLIKFNIDSLPANVNSATIHLYAWPGPDPNDPTPPNLSQAYLDRVTSPWDETTKWANRPTYVNITTLAQHEHDAWHILDITDLYNAWKDGTYTNYGIQMRPTTNCCNINNVFHSSDYMEDPSLRPKLVLEIDTQNISLVINQVNISKYPTIEIFLSVSDQNGNSIDNLTQENFSLFEDGNEYSQFEVYPPGTYTFPISVALALDYSGSMADSDSVPDLENAVKQFIDGLDSDDKAEIIIFKNNEVFVAQKFTSDKDLLKNAIGGDAEGGTALYDAIYQAISDTAMQDDRKAVIVMTDGKDRTSKYYTKEDVILYSQQTGIPIFCVGLGDADQAILQEISDETGGQFFYAPTSDDLTSIYQEIGEVLQDQYLLSYQTTIADNLSHQVEIQATSDGKTGSDIKDFQLNLDYPPYFENASLPTSATIPEIINFSGSVKDDIELSQITMIVDGPSGVHTVFTEDLSGTSTSLSGYFFDSGNTTYANAPGSYNVELKVVDSSNHSTSQNFTVNILGGYQNSIAEIIGTWSDGIRYWDVAVSEWTKMTASTPTGDIAAGDFTGDGKADVASCWGSGLWYQDGATVGWTKVSGAAPNSLTAGDVTGDDQAEIIGTWSSGIWYWDVAASEWTKMSSGMPSGDITAGDFTGDGKADVASIWASGLWFQDGGSLAWTKVTGSAPNSLTAGDVSGDGRSEIISAWSSGIWYWDMAESKWTRMTSSTPTGDIAAGDFTGDGKADVASCWGSGLWYQDGASLVWTKISSQIPSEVTSGDVTGD